MKTTLILTHMCIALLVACGGSAPAAKTTPTGGTAAKKAIPPEKAHPVPGDWTELADAKKGYSFHVPAGTTDTQKSVGGVDFYFAQTPAPHNIEVMVAAFKDAKLSKDDLLKHAEEALGALGNKQIARGTVTEVNDDYSVAEMTMLDESAVKYKTLVLVATDVTDNYIMIIGTPETEFAKNKDTLDAIWGSFQMWSGGASGES